MERRTISAIMFFLGIKKTNTEDEKNKELFALNERAIKHSAQLHLHNAERSRRYKYAFRRKRRIEKA